MDFFFFKVKFHTIIITMVTIHKLVEVSNVTHPSLPPPTPSRMEFVGRLIRLLAKVLQFPASIDVPKFSTNERYNKLAKLFQFFFPFVEWPLHATQVRYWGVNSFVL
jgi:hypothetical protein